MDKFERLATPPEITDIEVKLFAGNELSEDELKKLLDWADTSHKQAMDIARNFGFIGLEG